MEDHRFDNHDELSVFARSDEARKNGRIYYSGPDVQDFSKAMYEASKLNINWWQTYIKGGTAIAIPGIGAMIGAVAAPITIPTFAIAYIAAGFYNRKADERVKVFVSGFPFGETAWLLLKRGWQVTSNDVKSIELQK